MKKILLVVSFLLLLFFVTTTSRSQGMRVGVQIGAGFPTGDWSDYVSTGMGGIGTFHYELNKKISLTGALGYYSFGSAKDVQEALGSLGDYSYSITPIVAGIRYGLGKEGESFQPYLGGEIGMYLWSFTYKIKTSLGNAELDESGSEFGFAPMVGFKFNINKDVDIDINAKYSIVEDINHFVINFGVIFNI